MTPSTRVSVIYMVSLGVAGGVAYFRGKRGYDLVRDSVCYGVAGGTAANLMVYVSLPKAKRVAEMKDGLGAIANVGKETLSQEGLRLLRKIDTSKLYADLKDGGIKVAAIPADPHMVVQEPT